MPQQGSESLVQSRNEQVRELAHDVRHCLFTIRTGVLLLRETCTFGPDSQQLFELIEKDETQLAGLIEKLVALAREDRESEG